MVGQNLLRVVVTTTTSPKMVTLNPSTSGEEDSQLEQDGSPLASGQEEMATNLRVVADISSSRRSFNWFFFGGGGFGGLVLGC